MERKLLLAFDVDGTLECGDPKGPIKLKTLKKLKESDIIIGIIGARERVQKSLKEIDFYYPGDPPKTPEPATGKGGVQTCISCVCSG